MNHFLSLPGAGALLLSVLLLGSCSRDADHDADHDADRKPAAGAPAGRPDERPLGPNEVVLRQNQLTAIGVTLGGLTTQNLSSVIKATGTVSLPPQNRASVSAYQGGLVRSLPVAEGQRVSRGQVLATLENPDFVQLQQDYLNQRNQFTFLEAEYQRQTALLAEKVGVAKNVQQTAANYNAARASLRSLESRLTTLGVALGPLDAGRVVSQLPLKAPIAGRLRYLPGLALGASVTPSQPLFEVLDTRRLFVDVQVFEQDYGQVRKGQTVHITFPSLEGQPAVTGTVSFIDQAFDPATKSVKVRAVIDGNQNDQLVPGLFANAVIDVGGAAGAAAAVTSALPDGAIVPAGESSYFFVLKEKRQEAGETEYVFEKREVKTGASAKGFTAVTPVDPLAPGTRVVTAGAYYLQAQLRNGSGEPAGENDGDGDGDGDKPGEVD